MTDGCVIEEWIPQLCSSHPDQPGSLAALILDPGPLRSAPHMLRPHGHPTKALLYNAVEQDTVCSHAVFISAHASRPGLRRIDDTPSPSQLRGPSTQSAHMPLL